MFKLNEDNINIDNEHIYITDFNSGFTIETGTYKNINYFIEYDNFLIYEKYINFIIDLYYETYNKNIVNLKKNNNEDYIYKIYSNHINFDSCETLYKKYISFVLYFSNHPPELYIDNLKKITSIFIFDKYYNIIVGKATKEKFNSVLDEYNNGIYEYLIKGIKKLLSRKDTRERIINFIESNNLIQKIRNMYIKKLNNYIGYEEFI